MSIGGVCGADGFSETSDPSLTAWRSEASARAETYRPHGRAIIMRRRGPYRFIVLDLLALTGATCAGCRSSNARGYFLKSCRGIALHPVAKHIPKRGRDLFAAGCEQGLEGIVAKWKGAPYNPAALPLSWIEIRNPDYSQARDRADLFHR